MWFGTPEYMVEVPDPAINYDASRVGWEGKSQYLNGGAAIRRSTASHREYNFSWNLQAYENVRPIMDFADGVYGPGPFYFVDWFAAKQNVLPQHLATPALAIDDAPVLVGEARPIAVRTNANTNGYPLMSARYTVKPSDPRLSTFVPIPPGYSLWMGVHGYAGTGGRVEVLPVFPGGTVGPPITVPIYGVTSRDRVYRSFDGDAYVGAYVRLNGEGTITLSGIMGQLLKNGESPQIGGFISGQGNGGCLFESQPTLTHYSAVMNKVGLNAKLVETEPWA